MPEPSEVGRAIAQLKADTGMTWGQLADQLGASSGDYVRKVAGGAKPGTNLAGNVRQLSETGKVTAPVPRRRNKAGEIARVRSKADEATGERSVTPRERTTFTKDTQLTHQGRGRVVTVTVPRTEGVGRERAREAIMDAVRSAARGRRRVSFKITRGGMTGSLYSNGGRAASQVLIFMRAEGNDPLAFFGDELDNTAYAAQSGKITRVEITVWPGRR